MLSVRVQQTCFSFEYVVYMDFTSQDSLAEKTKQIVNVLII